MPSTDDLRDALERDYGIDARAIDGHDGGFKSECFVVDDTWFVKCWRYDVVSDLELLDRLAGGLPVPTAHPTTTGARSARIGDRVYAVFPYVRGRTATEPGDWRATALALRRVHDTDTRGLDLEPSVLDESWCIDNLRASLDHPWIADRADEVARNVDRLESAIERGRATAVPRVLVHNDFGELNLLLDDDGDVAAILDWDFARLAPREHDVWIAAELGCIPAFLGAYGTSGADLDPTHLEYALLARALRDMAARVVNGVDRDGIEPWGFDRIARLDTDLAQFAAHRLR